MTILQIITSATCWAGMEQYAFDLSKGLIAQGHKVIFVIAKNGDLIVPRFESVGKVYRLSIGSKFNWRSIIKLRKIIKSERPDIIHTHQPKNIFQAHFARGGSKHIAIVHTLHFVLRPTSPQWLYSWIFGRANKIIAVSELVRLNALKIYPNLNPDNVVTIPNSIDQRRFESVIHGGQNQSQVVIGYAGRLVPQKGIGVVIDAAVKLKSEGVDFKLLIAGTGSDDYVDALKERIKSSKIGENVEFMGFVDDMSTFISEIDIAVVPSICREAGSLMVLEYMATGMALISTNNGSQPEFIDSMQNGILIDPDDAQTLAANLKLLIQDEALRRQLGENAKAKFMEELSVEHFMERTVGVYDSVKRG